MSRDIENVIDEVWRTFPRGRRKRATVGEPTSAL
jgi:hypothetical protein